MFGPEKYIDRCGYQAHARSIACKKRAKIKSVNKMALSRFATLNDEEISKLLTEKDSKNIRRSTNACETVSEDYQILVESYWYTIANAVI